MSEALMVGMAEVKVCRSPDMALLALGLGSCIGICAFDARAGVAGLAHVVLPGSEGHVGSRGKFADTAVLYLLEEMFRLGAVKSRVRVAMAGGAQLFAGTASNSRLDIGPRNTAAVRAELERHGLSIAATDLGGSVGRTVTLFGDGRVHVKTIGKGQQQLVQLGVAASLSGKETTSGRTLSLLGCFVSAQPEEREVDGTRRAANG